MKETILSSKLFIPLPRPSIVPRLRLTTRLNAGIASGCKLTLVSTPAGFGKTTLVSEWIAGCGRTVAWLSLDEADSDPSRFLTYLIAALQTITPTIGAGVLGTLQSPQPPSMESIITILLNEIATIPDNFIFVFDDYHIIDSKPVDKALTFLLEHLPPQMHLVITTREDPDLPLARLRARDQLTELRATDLQFSQTETAEFLNRVMGLNLSVEDVAALEARTEGWIAGLQLAALSMRGRDDIAGFIQAFTGSHRFVLDYLLEEVLNHLPDEIQTFLLRTSILERLCGPLCDAVLLIPPASGQETLEYLEHANLFIISLDNERRWYRYHHLFSDLLRKQLGQSRTPEEITELHIHASEWFEKNGLMLDAFRHATAANDIERAERLMESRGIPLHQLGATTIIMNWLDALPKAVLDARPSLWVRSATLLLAGGQPTGSEEKLQAAESAIDSFLQGTEPDNMMRDLIGQIAAARATVASARYETETMITQSRRALEFLSPDNLYFRFRANWTLARAYHYKGERAEAGRIYSEALSIAQASGDIHNTSLATTCIGQIQELENQLYPAFDSFQNALQLLGNDYLPPYASAGYLGLAHINYEWNDLDAAQQYAQQSLQLARQYDQAMDRFIMSEVFLARLMLARGDINGAADMLANTSRSVQQHHYVHRVVDVAAQQVTVLLRQGDLVAAAELAQQYNLPVSRARVLLAQGNPSAALALLEPFRRQMEANDWQDDRLKAIVLQALALDMLGEEDRAMQTLGEGLALAEPNGFIRLFVDEGAAMAKLLSAAATQGIHSHYARKLLTVFEGESNAEQMTATIPGSSSLLEPLSSRELEVLGLVALGLSNQEICKRLYLALDTVKGHNRRIFEKLQVKRRTEAIARARELGLL